MKDIYNNWRWYKNDNSYYDLKSTIEFWNNPNKCKRCEQYHWLQEKCPSNKRCNRCNEEGHRGTVCNNITFIYNLTYKCGCLQWSVINKRSVAQTKYSTHCCVCHEPKKIWEMQVSTDKKRVRCNECKNKEEKRNNEKRRMTPPSTPPPNKKNMYEKKDEEQKVELYDSPEEMDVDPKEENSNQTMKQNTNEETTVTIIKKPNCTCWQNKTKKHDWCEKHQHKPHIGPLGECLLCNKSPKIEETHKNIITKEDKEELLRCLKCNRYIDWWSTKAKCLAGSYTYCQSCYNKIESDIDIEFYQEKDAKRCPVHMTCLLFISKMARKRYHDMDGEMQIELENKLFHKDIKECMCPTCERIGILWYDGNEI